MKIVVYAWRNINAAPRADLSAASSGIDSAQNCGFRGT